MKHQLSSSALSAPVAIVAAICMLTACGGRIAISENISNSDTDTPSVEGLVYSLPQTLITVSALEQNGVVTYSLTPNIVPDPTALYRLRRVENDFAEIDIHVTVNAAGLLSTAQSTATDKTGAIITALAKTAGAGVGAAANLPPVDAAKPPSKYPFTKVFSLSEFLDGQTLPDGVRIIPAESAFTKKVKEMDKAAKVAEEAKAPPCNFSLCYRTPVLVRARLLRTDRKIGEGEDIAVLVIDPTRTEGLDLRSAGLVERKTDYAFIDGVATGSKVSQGSTALAIANLPLEVLKTVLAVPAELLTLKVTNVNAEGNLEKGKAELANQQRLVIEAVDKLNKASAPVPKAVVGSGTSP